MVTLPYDAEQQRVFDFLEVMHRIIVAHRMTADASGRSHYVLEGSFATQRSHLLPWIERLNTIRLATPLRNIVLKCGVVTAWLDVYVNGVTPPKQSHDKPAQVNCRFPFEHFLFEHFCL